jgi:TetR/AcrR family transcriptional regulator
MARRPSVSPERILASAAIEFASRGYAGARVDRIARRARVNKAMLYYHFGSKRNLYRTLLRDTFGALAGTLRQIAETDMPPDARLRGAVSAIATFVDAHAFFPAVMLREMAEGGAHLDGETMAALAAIPRSFAAILQPGINAGYFRAMHPIASYFTTIAPIVMFVASTPLRKQLATRHLLPPGDPLTPSRFLEHLTVSLEHAFTNTPPTPRPSHA